MSSRVSLNVRFLLWSRQVPRPEWVRWLASRAGLGLQVCRDLVRGRIADDVITSSQLAELSRAFDLAEDGSELRFHDLLLDSGRNILLENLKFLFDSLEHGGKKRLAASMGVDPTTISRWLNGASEPQGPALRQLVAHFGLPVGTDLKCDPVFLSVDPVSAVARRHWIRDRLDHLSEQELQELYPALRRLLEDEQ